MALLSAMLQLARAASAWTVVPLAARLPGKKAKIMKIGRACCAVTDLTS